MAMELNHGMAEEYQLTLFVAGDELNSRLARQRLKGLCENELDGRCRIKVVDVLEDFAAAANCSIVVMPTLLIEKSGQEYRVIGNLKDLDKVRRLLGVEELNDAEDA